VVALSFLKVQSLGDAARSFARIRFCRQTRGVPPVCQRNANERLSPMPRHHQRGPAKSSSKASASRAAGPDSSQRQLRVAELVRHAVSEILSQGNVHDPALEGHIITVPEVRMSPDLKLATIYVMPLGGRGVEDVVTALEHNKKYLRGEIARRVNLKFAPDIRFRVDERFDEAERIEKLLRTPAVQKDLAHDRDDADRNSDQESIQNTIQESTKESDHDE
jgi:ribosome-binding factor A